MDQFFSLLKIGLTLGITTAALVVYFDRFDEPVHIDVLVVVGVPIVAHFLIEKTLGRFIGEG